MLVTNVSVHLRLLEAVAGGSLVREIVNGELLKFPSIRCTRLENDEPCVVRLNPRGVSVESTGKRQCIDRGGDLISISLGNALNPNFGLPAAGDLVQFDADIAIVAHDWPNSLRYFRVTDGVEVTNKLCGALLLTYRSWSFVRFSPRGAESHYTVLSSWPKSETANPPCDDELPF